LTYANLKQEVDKQSLSQVPLTVRLAHMNLMEQLIASTKAYTAYLRDGAEPPPDLKRELMKLQRQLADMQTNYPALAQILWKAPNGT
jgi:CRISPR/Cas system-associated endonuclease Cas3-HD